MAARPRKHNVNVPNLYPLYSHKTKKLYWRYKHPQTGVFVSLGTDESAATEAAIELNTIFAEQRTRQMLALADKIAKIKGKEITVSTWLDRYWEIQEERLSANEIKLNTYKQKRKPVDLMRQYFGLKSLPLIDVRDIVSILEIYKSSGQLRMAQVVRSVFIDIFKEAQQAGEVPPGYNPALATKQLRQKISRQRLDLDEWKIIYEEAGKRHRYTQHAMLLAIVTGQRLGDISSMKFSDIWDGYLHVIQEKTGTKIAIPLSLRCNALNISLEEVVTQCRDAVLSKYLVHYFRTTSMSQRGARVTPNTITTNFTMARDSSGINWEEGTPPTFHEQRSLSERLYREQGVDTKKLLGHKSQQMTDRYNDDRGKDWLTI